MSSWAPKGKKWIGNMCSLKLFARSSEMPQRSQTHYWKSSLVQRRKKRELLLVPSKQKRMRISPRECWSGLLTHYRDIKSMQNVFQNCQLRSISALLWCRCHRSDFFSLPLEQSRTKGSAACALWWFMRWSSFIRTAICWGWPRKLCCMQHHSCCSCPTTMTMLLLYPVFVHS